MPPTAAMYRRRRIATVVALLLIVVLGVAAVFGVRWFQQRAEAERQQELYATSAEAVRAYEDSVLALLSPGVVTLAMVTGTADESAETVAGIQEECARVSEYADTVESAWTTLGEAPEVPDDLDEDFPGAAQLRVRPGQAQSAAQEYAAAIADAAKQVARFCGGYPALAQIMAQQDTAVTSLTESLTACTEAEEGCLPQDTSAWPALRGDLEAVFVTPHRERAQLLAEWCPTDALAPVCAARAEGDSALAAAGDAYLDAVDSQSREAVAAARAGIAEEREAADALLAAAVTEALGESGTGGSEERIAAAIREWTRTVQAEWLAADEALMRAVG
ncbi:hypothetical protein [Serinibacter salmoneus]|uniref:Uncharacterized protein n=1 Tax=Serinibacter salmoneus TaxID=556530 RepID=A0A2A9CX77_9MICO|nr:hypothetical protein [Serinibacter salmoneus]PFG19003.1 hypothetical protein ATL40_0557 [Serinibacter salmoneus]